MSIHLDPTSRPAALRPPIEARPPAPAGLGQGTSTLQSLAEPEDSGCCLWKMLSTFWTWLTGATSKLQSHRDYFEKKAEKILAQHFSQRILDRINQPSWKGGVVFQLDEEVFFHYKVLHRGDSLAFRDAMIEFVKNMPGVITSDSELHIKTLFMKSANGKNDLITAKNTIVSEGKQPHFATEDFAEDLAEDETREFFADAAYPREFINFFVNL